MRKNTFEQRRTNNNVLWSKFFEPALPGSSQEMWSFTGDVVLVDFYLDNAGEALCYNGVRVTILELVKILN